MTEIEPKVDMDGRYSPKETSRLLDIHRNTLRVYANNGDIKYGVRRHNSRKFYLGAEIVRFWRAKA